MDPLKLQYQVEINKTGDGAIRGTAELRQLEEQGQRTARQMDDFKAAAQRAVAAIAGAAVIRQSVREFTDYEQAVARLNGTLAALGKGGSSATRQLQELARAVTLPAGATEGGALGVITELVRNGAATSELPRLTQMVLDLAGAGVSLERASDAMGNALAGDFGKIAQITNGVFPAAAGRAQNLADALALVEQRFGGLAAASLGTATGQLALAQRGMADLQREMGRLMLTAAQPALREFTASLEGLNRTLANPAVRDFIGTVLRDLTVGLTTATAAALALRAAAQWQLVFGPGPVKGIQDFTSALALLGEKHATLLKTLGVLGALYGGFKIGEAAMKSGEALGQEANATALLGQQQAMLVERLREVLRLRVQLGELAQGRADEILGPVDSTFARVGNTDLRAAALKRAYAQLLPDAGTNPNLTNKYDPAMAALVMAQVQREAQLNAARNAVRLPGGTNAIAGPGLLLAPGQAQHEVLTSSLDAQRRKLDELHSAGTIRLHEHTEAVAQLKQAYGVGLASAAQSGWQAIFDIHQQSLSAEGARVQVVEESFRSQRVAASDYYAYLRQVMGETFFEQMGYGEKEKQLYAELAAQKQTALRAASDVGQMVIDISNRGTQALTQGLSGAMVQFASGAKSAKEAFGQFAASFMQQIAQMIMQALLLRAVAGIMGGFGAGASTIKAVTGLAEGGFAPRMAAAGMIAGTQTVNSATYFPQFNTVAGEAGSEVLAVLSRPRFMEIGGLASYVGSVQGQRVAMTNADDLARSAGGRGGAGGRMVIEVRGTRDFEARVIDSSIEGAVVRVVNDLNTDTPMSSAVKGLTS